MRLFLSLRFGAEGRVVFSPSGVFASWIDGFAPSRVTMIDDGWGWRRIGTRTHPADATLCAHSDGKAGVFRLVARDCGPSVCSDPPRSTPLKRALVPRGEPDHNHFMFDRSSDWAISGEP